MRFLVASATAMVIIGIFGILSQGLRSDWLGFYTGGKFLIEGNAGDLYNPDLIHAWQEPLIGDYFIQFLYAPAFAILYAPLAWAPLSVARVIWTIITLVAALAAAWISSRWSGLSKQVSMLGIVAFPPLAYSLAVGQNSALTLLIFAGVAWLEWKGRQDYLPGVLAGLALYKPQLLIPLLIFWLVKKRWKSLLGFIGSGFIIGVISLIISPGATLEYLQFTFTFFQRAEQGGASTSNISSFAIQPVLGIIVAIVVLSILFLLSRQKNKRYLIAILWLAPLLVTPYIIIYDMLLLALPISFLVPDLVRDRILQVGVGLIWLSTLFAPIFMSVRPVTFSVLILYILCVYRILKPIPKDRYPFPELNPNE
jgi:hypothetical protein